MKTIDILGVNGRHLVSQKYNNRDVRICCCIFEYSYMLNSPDYFIYSVFSTGPKRGYMKQVCEAFGKVTLIGTSSFVFSVAFFIQAIGSCQDTMAFIQQLKDSAISN